jgi:hypothetical protein
LACNLLYNKKKDRYHGKRREIMKKTILSAVASTVLCMLPMANVVYGFGYNPADLAKLKATNACYRCNLIFAPLTGASLINAQLESASLMSAKLNKANLSGAKLTYAMLSEANLSGANLSNANMENAQLMGANLTGAILTNANLSWATWTDGSTCGEGSIGKCNKVLNDKIKK